MATQEAHYAEHRPMLFGLAYRMLGSASDAEDIVQDVFARYMRLDAAGIGNEKAYLAKMTTNRCLNELQSSKRRREAYTGSWLPEPLPDEAAGGRGGEGYWSDPAERRGNIGYAYLVLLQKLSPLERAIYVLKETIGFEYADLADMLDKTEASCRKTFSRAQAKVKEAAPSASSAPPSSLDEEREEARERFIDAFLRASDTGNFKPLLSFLLDEVTLLSDGGGKVRTALNPIIGIGRVQAFFEGIVAKGAFKEGFRRVRLNGEPGLALYRDGQATIVLCLEMEREPEGSRVRSIYMVRNPDKLTRFG
ncbi:sigma-70 family RNA polymerase sigma factor [Cohnella suwonensis]|uniref:Sigma-70 family RNA polymerase sigma factor n=1 Tax=Cohnella suwonensis TaxID=696072 RepID=A0ABW0LSQ5_9BACL